MIFFDGICALCNGVVTFVLKLDQVRTVRFAPLQGETAARLLAGPRDLAGIDSIVWLDRSGAALTRSAAVLEICRYLGGLWVALAALGRFVPRPLADAIYDGVARRRYRVFGRLDACPVPAPEHRARFLP